MEKLFRAFPEKRKRELPQFTPDGIPITLENKFDDAIYNYLYEYWKTNSGEYDPKKDVIPESEMNKMHPKTKNEKKFEQWLLQQYGMTNKEQREYTLKGNLESLWEIFSAADMVLFARGLPSIGKELAQLGKKAVDDVAEEVVEKTVKTEVAEEVAENTTKKEMADTTEDLSQKTVDKDDSSVIKGGDKLKISNESKEKWSKGSFDSVEDSLKYHFKEHGEEVGATNIDQYVRKAEGFSQNLRGAHKSYPPNGTPGAVRYTKNGKYIIIGPNGKILSFGLAR